MDFKTNAEKIISYGRHVSVVLMLAVSIVGVTEIKSVRLELNSTTAELGRIGAKADKAIAIFAKSETDAVASRVVDLVSLKDVLHDCSADNSDVTCTFTNPHDKAIVTCFVGTAERTGSTISVHTIVACTGRMEPRSTSTVRVPFEGARVSHICPRDGYPSLPDWDKCEFRVSLPTNENTRR